MMGLLTHWQPQIAAVHELLHGFSSLAINSGRGRADHTPSRVLTQMLRTTRGL